MNFTETWSVDSEFIVIPGERPRPVCYVAVSVTTGEVRRVWLADEAIPPTPIPVNSSTLMVSYASTAELGVHLALGWALPANVLDLHVEHRLLVNGQVGSWGMPNLIGLCHRFSCPAPALEFKERMRSRILQGPPFTLPEKAEILGYCEQDARLQIGPFLKMQSQLDFTRAIRLRGEFMKVAARMDHEGIPIDVEAYEAIRRRLPDVWKKLVAKEDVLGIYPDGHLSHARLKEVADRLKIYWPRTPQACLKHDQETWSSMAAQYPNQFGPYGNLAHVQKWLRGGLDLRVGYDGRCRPKVMHFAQKTGRSSPSASFPFALPRWVRGLIRAPQGERLIYADYSQQEPALMGSLSGDPELRESYHNSRGSLYVDWMARINEAPLDATRTTHPEVHERGKPLQLSLCYGGGPALLASKMRVTPIEASFAQDRLKRIFQSFHSWRESVVLTAHSRGFIQTVDGWRMEVNSSTCERTLFNWPLQATGACMTRLAAILADLAGPKVLATIHDAILFRVPAEDVLSIDCIHQSMDAAAGLIAPGYGIRHDLEIIEPGARFPLRGGAAAFLEHYHGNGGRG